MCIRNLFKTVTVSICLSLGLGGVVYAAEDAAPESATVEAGSGYMQLKPTITTNYQSPRLKYVRTDVAIRVNNKALDTLTLHKDPIRDIIIMLLGRQDKEMLTTTEGIDAIREEAKEEITAYFGFPNYVDPIEKKFFYSLLRLQALLFLT